MATVHLGTPQVRSRQEDVDAVGLAAALARVVSGEVRFDPGSRGAYSTDASNYRQVPIGVVVPRSVDDVVATVATCRQFGAPVLSRGGGTSLAGQCCNVAVVMDFSKYLHQVLEIDPDRRLVRVQPGIVLDDLRRATAPYGLTFGPDPATHDHCTIGGMLGNNSCGMHAQMAGRTSDNTHQLEVVTYDGLRLRVGPTGEQELDRIAAEGGRRGELYRRLRKLRDYYGDLVRQRYPKIPRRISGYALDELLPENGFHLARALVGSESTCVTILEATLELLPWPSAQTLVVLGYPDIYQAGDHLPEVLAHEPMALEGIDDRLIDYMRKKGLHAGELRVLPEGKGWLVVQFGGDSREEADAKAQALLDALPKTNDPPSSKLIDDPAEEAKVWAIRESGLGATARVPGERDTWPGWEDSAVPPDKVGGYLRDLRKLYDKYGYTPSLYGHFGQGCIHCRVDFDLYTADGIRAWRAFLDEAADLVVAYGGSFSGEHGDGQARADLLPKMYGPELMQAHREFKAIWDPNGRMNPGKIVDPNPITADLRVGPGYNPRPVATNFAFPDDDHQFARAVLRCVGVGKCRREDGEGVMCPSYMVTREEEHSTRGRARLLFELLNGEELADGWRSEAVHDALDLCLACKGCKTDCPVNVDMATYKAEFLSHYYQRRLRPRSAYAIGLIWWVARLASKAPWAANLLTQTPGLRGLAKRLAGIAPQRQLPPFADEPFTAWFRRRGRPPGGPDRPPVLLWPDTFNNYFHPGTARAAVEVLEAAGFRVLLPGRPLCCGRPLYDYGMLRLAKRLLRQVLEELRPQIRAGLPVVGLEPSCLAVFRDELGNLFPGDQDAQRLASQACTLAEFFQRHAPDFQPPRLEARALVQRHCHHHAVMGFGPDQRLLQRMGPDAEVLESGCCGMAGSFGFERGDHYQVAAAAGERVLLPRVRQASDDELVIADGFSCRTQIEQGTGRRGLHLAEVLRLALHADEPGMADGRLPEVVNVELDERAAGRRAAAGRRRTLALISAGAAAGACVYRWRARRA